MSCQTCPSKPSYAPFRRFAAFTAPSPFAPTAPGYAGVALGASSPVRMARQIVPQCGGPGQPSCIQPYYPPAPTNWLALALVGGGVAAAVIGLRGRL